MCYAGPSGFFVITIANQADRQRRAIYERRCLNLITVLFGWLTALACWFLRLTARLWRAVCVSVAHTGAAGMSTTTGRAGPGRPAVAIFCWALYEFNLESVFIYTRVFLQRVNAGQIEIYYVKACKILSHLHRLWLHPARLEFWLS
jgi:hypothetical protein